MTTRRRCAVWEGCHTITHLLELGGFSSDHLVTSGDYIRIWNVNGEQHKLGKLLRHEANPREVCTPITSVDAAPRASGAGLASCDIYGICALWDVEAGVATAATDLGQPLCDVAFGPGGLLAAAGENGDVFLMDPRQAEKVDVLTVRDRVGGPARMAWSPSASGMLAVAWQGESGGLAVYNGPRKGPGQLLQSANLQCGAVADLQWCPASPEYLCCASEGAGVEVWQIGSQMVREAPCFCWQPRAGEVLTSLALSSRANQQLVMLATMPAHATQGGGVASLWVAGLPEFSKSSDSSNGSNSVGEAGGLAIATPIMAAVS